MISKGASKRKSSDHKQNGKGNHSRLIMREEAEGNMGQSCNSKHKINQGQLIIAFPFESSDQENSEWEERYMQGCEEGSLWSPADLREIVGEPNFNAVVVRIQESVVEDEKRIGGFL